MSTSRLKVKGDTAEVETANYKNEIDLMRILMRMASMILNDNDIL